MPWAELPLVSLTLFTPVVAAGAMLLLPRERRRAIIAVATAAAIVAFLLTLVLFLSYLAEPGGYQHQERHAWLPSLGITFHVGLDGVGTLLYMLTGIVSMSAVLLGWTVHERQKEFYFFLFLLIAGVYGVFGSLDLFFLFFFYELAALPMYPLIGVWGASTQFPRYLLSKEYGALKLVIYLLLGSVLVWIGLAALFVESGQVGFDLFALKQVSFSREFQIAVFPLFAVGFGVLATLWPFHTWSPDGHVAAPTPVSMLHAGVLTKLGAFGILRVGMEVLPEGAAFWMPALAAFALVNIIYGAVVTTAQTDLKYVVGYSSVGHMGYILLGLATLHPLGLAGAVLQMFAHGVLSALFFAVVGVVYDRAHTRDMALFQGLARRMGKTAGLFTVVGLASLALPGTSSFVAELLVVLGAFGRASELAGQPLALLYLAAGVAGVVGALITAVYILRMLTRVFFGPLDSRWQGMTDAGPREALAAGLLVAAILVVGLLPFPFLSVIDGGLEAILPLFRGGAG